VVQDDPQGNLTIASGNIVRSYKYDAFGKVSNPPSVDNLFSADPYAGFGTAFRA
jgi:hypothetical protein